MTAYGGDSEQTVANILSLIPEGSALSPTVMRFASAVPGRSSSHAGHACRHAPSTIGDAKAREANSRAHLDGAEQQTAQRGLNLLLAGLRIALLRGCAARAALGCDSTGAGPSAGAEVDAEVGLGLLQELYGWALALALGWLRLAAGLGCAGGASRLGVNRGWPVGAQRGGHCRAARAVRDAVSSATA